MILLYQRTNNIKPVVEGGILTSIAIIFAIMSAYLPLVGTFINFIWPVPIIILGVRHGYQWSIMATTAAGVIIALLLHPLQAIGVVVGFGLIGIVVGHGFRQGYSPLKTFIFGTVASFVSKLAVLGIAFIITGLNPIEVQNQAMAAGIEESIEIYRSLGVDERELKKMTETFPSMLELMKIIMPAALVIAAALDTYLNFHIARVILGKLGHRPPSFPPFKKWTMPRETVYFLIVALLMIYWGSSRLIDMLYNAGVNLQMITTIILMIQGMALTYYLADKYNLSGLKIGAILIVLMLTGLLTQVLLFAGAFDLLFDYRKIRRPQGGG